MNNQQFKKILYGILPVVLFGFVTGYILWYKIFEYPPHRYSLDFDGSMWISTGKQTPNGYFVKEIFIPEEVADAWITVAATDDVELSVNGIKIASDTFVSLNISSIHDVTGKIQPGKNVIAAYISRSSYPGSPRLLLKGVYTDLSGREHIFTSDDTWVVSSVEEIQGQGTIPWYSIQFDHSGWVKAILEGRPSTFPIYTSPLSPYILGKSLSGYWLWYPEQDVNSAYFIKSFVVNSLARDGIIGVAGSSAYDLTVNGVSVATHGIFNKNLDIYNIAPLLHSGENTIGIGVKSLETETAPGLFLEGYIYDGNSIIHLKSDGTWKTMANIPSEKNISDLNSSEWKVPTLLSKYPSQPWGILSKTIKDIDFPLTYTSKQLLKFSFFILMVISAILCFWVAIAFLYARTKNDNIWDWLLLDGILHIPPLLFVFFIYLFKFDVRYDPSFPFQSKFVLISLGILFLLRIVQFVGIHIKNRSSKFLETENKQASNLLLIFLLVFLIITGFLIRLNELDYTSLSHDEISMMQFTEGLLNKGVPFKVVGPLIKPLTTYEILPYSISIPVILFGFNDYAARLHSVFWGTLEILLLYILGKTLFNRIVGFVAAAIYTFHPWCIIWSQNIFWPQLTQVLTTLTILFFYKAIDSTPMNRKFLYLTGISFSLMYLSWEGSGFLLVAMLIALFIHRRSDLSWLSNKHLWASFAIVFLTVFIQMSRRILYQLLYLNIGISISDISFSLFFLDPMYDPYYYINQFFFTENNYILSIFSIVGLCLLLKNRPMRYLYIFIFSTVFCLTNFISVSANRYAYNLEPFLILIASAVGFVCVGALKNLFREKTMIMRLSTSLSAIATAIILFMASNNIFFNLYLISNKPSTPPVLTRQNVYWNDYKSTNKYVSENKRKGDLIFVMMPHTLKYYTGITGDFSLTTMYGRSMVFDISEKYPGFLDKYIGNPAVTSLNDFKNLIGKYNRIWFISAPKTALTAASDKETINYIRKSFKVVYESYNTNVYLWEK